MFNTDETKLLAEKVLNKLLSDALHKLDKSTESRVTQNYIKLINENEELIKDMNISLVDTTVTDIYYITDMTLRLFKDYFVGWSLKFHMEDDLPYVVLMFYTRKKDSKKRNLKQGYICKSYPYHLTKLNGDEITDMDRINLNNFMEDYTSNEELRNDIDEHLNKVLSYLRREQYKSFGDLTKKINDYKMKKFIMNMCE